MDFLGGKGAAVIWRAVSDTARQLSLLPHVVVRERTVEASGRLGEFVWCQAEFAGGCGDHLRRDVAAAALATHVVERVADGVHVEGFRGEVLLSFFLHFMCVLMLPVHQTVRACVLCRVI